MPLTLPAFPMVERRVDLELRPGAIARNAQGDHAGHDRNRLRKILI
jgi:hypothetical protein